MRLHRKAIAIGMAVFAVGILTAATLIVTGGRNGASAQTETEGHSVTVDGYGTVEVEPDSATLHFAVEGEGESEDAARDDAAALADEVVAALQEQGVNADTITISEIKAAPGGPEGENDEGQGYMAFAHVSATLDDVAQAEAILDAVTTATSVERAGVEYSVSEDSPAWQEAREAALEDARQRAENLAALLDGSLGEVVSVREVSHPGGAAGFAVHPGGPGFGFGGGPIVGSGEFEFDFEHDVEFADEIVEILGDVPEAGAAPHVFAQEGGGFASGQSGVSVQLTVTWALN